MVGITNLARVQELDFRHRMATSDLLLARKRVVVTHLILLIKTFEIFLQPNVKIVQVLVALLL